MLKLDLLKEEIGTIESTSISIFLGVTEGNGGGAGLPLAWYSLGVGEGSRPASLGSVHSRA